VSRPIDAVVALPGSKSLTNRALIAASLAAGRSTLSGILLADDTHAMVDALRALGNTVLVKPDGPSVSIEGAGPPKSTGAVTLDSRQSGTTSRFLLAHVATGDGTFVVDGEEPIRLRPMGPLLDALDALGVVVEPTAGGLPVTVRAGGISGTQVELPADISSQFISALLLVGPVTAHGLTITLSTEPVSTPYLDMTLAVMETFGAHGAWQDNRTLRVEPGGYTPADYQVEPDASAASYFAAAAAMTGGTVTIPGLGTASLQGDVRFFDILRTMGAEVQTDDTSTTITGGDLRGVEVDMRHESDTAQTLAVVAATATGPTRITGIGFIRRKETDRIAATVTELQRCGIDAVEEPDGLVIHPGPIQPARVATYEDHRMAMSFALLGLVAEGIEIADAECVSKTFPDFFDVLAGITQ
jgi:3-phosphoshikimate 1-carboxyvinyltransferase